MDDCNAASLMINETLAPSEMETFENLKTEGGLEVTELRQQYQKSHLRVCGGTMKS